MLKARGCSRPIYSLPTGISYELRQFSGNFAVNEMVMQIKQLSHEFPLLCVTRLAIEKNCRFLLESFSLALRQIPKLKLFLVGTGPDLHKLQTMAKNLHMEDRVIFVGAISHKHLVRYYRCAKALLFVSKTETQGLPLAESAHFGLSIIAVRSQASLEAEGYFKAILTVDACILHFAQAIVDFYLSHKCNENSVNTERSCPQMFDQDYLSNRLLTIYQSLKVR